MPRQISRRMTEIKSSDVGIFLDQCLLLLLSSRTVKRLHLMQIYTPMAVERHSTAITFVPEILVPADDHTARVSFFRRQKA